MINTIPALIGLALALFDGYNWCGDLATRKFSVAGERETPRDALVTALLGSDQQFEQQDTPRICGPVDLAETRLWLGSITATSLSVTSIEARNGKLL